MGSMTQDNRRRKRSRTLRSADHFLICTPSTQSATTLYGQLPAFSNNLLQQPTTFYSAITLLYSEPLCSSFNMEARPHRRSRLYAPGIDYLVCISIQATVDENLSNPYAVQVTKVGAIAAYATTSYSHSSGHC